MPEQPTSGTPDLWTRVSSVHASLEEAGSHADAQQLDNAMTISAHPGEVWPATLAVLRELVARRPPGLDAELAAGCIADLERWP